MSSTSLTVSLTKPVNPIDAVAPALYELRKAGSHGFGSSDDVIYTLAPQYTANSTVITFGIQGLKAGELPPGSYRFTIFNIGISGLHGLNGLLLDGSGDGMPGGDYVYNFTITPPPSVSLVTPVDGPASGLTSVVITGSDFTAATAVDFGTGRPAASFVVDSDNMITAISPPGVVGPVDVTVSTPAGTSQNCACRPVHIRRRTDCCRYQSNERRNDGRHDGDHQRFGIHSATAVDFGAGHPATMFVVNSDGQITATSPPGVAGSVDVTVTTVGGTSQASQRDEFTYGAAHFMITAPGSTLAGSALVFTVTAEDALGATAASYTGTVHITSSDGQAIMSADGTLTGGVGIFGVTLRTAGNQTLTATDTTIGNLTGTSAAISVTGLAANHFAVSAPPTGITGKAMSFTVTAEDPFNNTAASYTGTVHFTSSDANALLPGNATLVNGAGVFSVTLESPGSQTLTATDASAAAITGTSSTILTRGLAVTSLCPPPPASSRHSTNHSIPRCSTSTTPQAAAGSMTCC